VELMQFHEPGISNYSELLLNKYQDILYVGAQEAIFALNALNISQKQLEVHWKASDETKADCIEKGRSKEKECFNYVRVLQHLTYDTLYVCGTNAFKPTCDYVNLTAFDFLWIKKDGRGKCPFDPTHTYTSTMVDGELYAGTTYNFLGSEFIISRNYFYSHLQTESDIPWLHEPNFVHADVIRNSPFDNKDDGDKVYFFFTELSVEYDFLLNLQVPRIARVCVLKVILTMFPQLLENLETPQNTQNSKFVYASSNSGVVQVPLAFCRKHSSCGECVLARDPYCAWSPSEHACVALSEALNCTRSPATQEEAQLNFSDLEHSINELVKFMSFSQQNGKQSEPALDTITSNASTD
ncbi:PREDICTED: semaphorin-4D-like, partial [Dipodomys ordii]|uniref:Semaphorin-4D-like n=1 Tax=Dipodomys ordii TaxID=10020 RepID=A0A1S3FQG6_DIPOR